MQASILETAVRTRAVPSRMKLRLAVIDDVPELTALIALSVRILQAPDYTESQREAALASVYGVDTQLVADQTYFVAEVDGTMVACGGWSKRRTLFGADHCAGRDSTRSSGGASQRARHRPPAA